MQLSINDINNLQAENAELKAQKDKYYQQTLDDEIQINELYQEIERLKAELQNYTSLQVEMPYDIKIRDLEQENERLKALLDVLEEDNKKLSKENDVFYNNSLQAVKEDLVKRVWNLQTENEELAHYLACMTEQRNKANICLQEIKEIAETAINGGYATKSSDYSEGMEIIGHYVMQKLTKAEEE